MTHHTDQTDHADPAAPDDALRALAERVLGSPADAEQFLTTPHALLGGRAPLEVSTTPGGAPRAEALLWRLEYSLPV